jgi:hypothetical protein
MISLGDLYEKTELRPPRGRPAGVAAAIPKGEWGSQPPYSILLKIHFSWQILTETLRGICDGDSPLSPNLGGSPGVRTAERLRIVMVPAKAVLPSNQRIITLISFWFPRYHEELS